MPRNSSGNYTLPLPPVVPDTIIESPWANTTLDDLAQAVTDSLDRFGRGGMAGPFRLVDGTVGAPGMAFTGETNTGMFRPSVGVLGFAVGGAQIMQLASTGVTFAGGFTTTSPVNVTLPAPGGRAFDGIVPSGNPVSLALTQTGVVRWEASNLATTGTLSIASSTGNLLSLGASGGMHLASGTPAENRASMFCFSVGTYATFGQWGGGASKQFSGFNVQGSVNADTYTYRRSGDVAAVLEQNGTLLFRTAPAGVAGADIVFTDRFTVDINGNTAVGGTLGVTGSTTLATLGVTGAATVGSTLGVTGAATLATLGVTGATTLTGALAANGGATVGTSVDGALALMNTTASAPVLNFGHGAGSGFYVKYANGPIGTGVVGDLVSEIVFDYNNTNRNVAIQWRRGSSTTGGYLQFNAGADTKMLSITDRGMVVFEPVGTGDAALTINSGAADQIAILARVGDETIGYVLRVENTNASVYQATIEHRASEVWFGNERAGATVLCTGHTERVRVSSGGSVLVAAPTSGYAIDANGQVRAVQYFMDTPTAGGAFSTLLIAAVPYAYWGHAVGVLGAGSGLAFRSESDFTIASGGATPRFTIGAGGNIYIGAAPSGASLTIGGLTAASDPGSSFAAIPIGGIAGGSYTGPGFTAVGPGGSIAFDGTNFITAIGPNSTTVAIQYGTWRSLGQQNAGYGMFMRIA